MLALLSWRWCAACLMLVGMEGRLVRWYDSVGRSFSGVLCLVDGVPAGAWALSPVRTHILPSLGSSYPPKAWVFNQDRIHLQRKGSRRCCLVVLACMWRCVAGRPLPGSASSLQASAVPCPPLALWSCSRSRLAVSGVAFWIVYVSGFSRFLRSTQLSQLIKK